MSDRQIFAATRKAIATMFMGLVSAAAPAGEGGMMTAEESCSMEASFIYNTAQARKAGVPAYKLIEAIGASTDWAPESQWSKFAEVYSRGLKDLVRVVYTSKQALVDKPGAYSSAYYFWCLDALGKDQQ